MWILRKPVKYARYFGGSAAAHNAVRLTVTTDQPSCLSSASLRKHVTAYGVSRRTGLSLDKASTVGELTRKSSMETGAGNCQHS